MKIIVQDGDPILRAKAKEVPKELFGSEELKGMLRDMKEAVDREPDGVALAAPQIGLSYRIFIVRFDRMTPPEEGEAMPRPPDIGIFINPEIIKKSKRKVGSDEGCLSVRGLYGTAERHERATVRAQDSTGKVFERGGGGLLAQAFQHEIDHLNGILFIDHAQNIRKHSGRVHQPFIFFGTPYVARDTLELLRERGFVPSLIVTSPDAPAGRGLALTASPTKEWALRRGIPVCTFEKLDKQAVEEITKYEASYAIVVAYGKLLPKKLLEAFPLGVVNIHYSLLPKYRGASPVEAALIENDTVTGVTIQKMVEKIDAGAILAQKKTAIGPGETTRELRARLIREGAHLLGDVLPLFEAGAIVPEEQDETQATYAGKITKEEGCLTLPGNDQENWNKYRAYAESPGTYFFTERRGKKIRVKIKTATFTNKMFRPERIVPEGKKEMQYEDFLKTN